MTTLADTITVPWTAQQYRALTAAIVDDEWGDHELCSLTACRLPLHPGPCKGWKHTLHLTAPGVYHTLERERVAKANARRTAKIAQLQSQGKPIPAALRRPITYSPPTATPVAKMGQHAEVVGGTSHTAAQAANASAGVVQKTAPNPHPQGTATAGTDSLAQAAKSQTVAQAAQAATPGKVSHGTATKTFPAPGAPGPAAQLHNPPGVPGSMRGPDQAHIANLLRDPATSDLTKATILAGLTEREFTDNFDATHRQLVVDKLHELSSHSDAATAKRATDGLAKISKYKGAPSPSAKAAPAAPSAAAPARPAIAGAPPSALPANASAAAKLAHATAGRTASRSLLSKTQVENYDKLSKADFDTLSDSTRAQIRSDLRTAKAKFLDPKKQKQADDLLTRFGGAPAAPAASAPSAPAPAKAAPGAMVSLPSMSWSGDRRLAAYEKIDKANFDTLPDAARARITRDLDMLSKHGSPLDAHGQQRANAAHTALRGAPPAPAKPVVVTPPAPAMGNQKAAAVAQAVKSGTTTSLLDSLENASRDDITQHLTTKERTELDRRLSVIQIGAASSSPTDQQRAKELRKALNSQVPSHLTEHNSLAEIAAAHNKGAMAGQIHAAQAVAGRGYTSHTADLAQHSYIADNVDFLATLDATNRDQLHELGRADFLSVTKRLDDIAANGKPDERDAAKALQDALEATGHPTTKQFGDIADELDAAKKAPPAAVEHPRITKVKNALAKLHAGGGDDAANDLRAEIRSARADLPAGPDRDALAAIETAIIGDKKVPAWLRSYLLITGPSAQSGGHNSAKGLRAIHAAQGMRPTAWSTFDVSDLFGATEADIAQMDPVHAQSVREARDEAISRLSKHQGYGVLQDVMRSVLKPGAPAPAGSRLSTLGKENFDSLGYQAKQDFVAGLERAASDSTGSVITRTGFQAMHDELTGKKYLPEQAKVIAHASAASKQITHAVLNDYSSIDKADFDALPKVYQDAISEHLQLLQSGLAGQGTGNGLSGPLTVRAYLRGEYPNYPRVTQTDAVLAATLEKDWLPPQHRADDYKNLTTDGFHDLTAADQKAVLADITTLSDMNSPLVGDPAVHWRMEYKRAHFSGDWAGYNINQQDALLSSDPTQPLSQAQSAYEDMTKADYDGLSPGARSMIYARVAQMDPVAQLTLAAKFHPQAAAPTPRSAPSVGYGMTVSSDPKVSTALDIIYGRHPKADAVTTQIHGYGSLRKDQFDQLNAAEQSQVLGDLSYIATTSKGSNAVKAKAFIDRFTPAGTAPGQYHGQVPAYPSVAVTGQTRLPTPTAGLLKQATDKGQAGDGWFTQPDGKKLWGRYGASGLLLAHDGADGKRRYLIVQRGPGISDPGKWQFPGGAIDSKESAYQGGTREVIEELGFKPGSLDSAVVHGYHEAAIGGGTWKYTSVAATVPDQLIPDLSTSHARAETSDAKWMTLEEIQALDTSGKLLAPLAGGKLEQNVISLFPPKAGAGTLGQAVKPQTKKLKRLTVAKPTAHKPSRGTNLVADKATKDKLRQDVKALRKQYDGKTADGRLAAIGHLQGFDDTPTVAPKSEIDRLLATGDYIEVWRGVRASYGGPSGKDINEQMRTGPAYYGRGVFGNGYYLATQRRVALDYSDSRPGSMLRALIPKAALTERHDVIVREAHAASSSTSKAKGSYEDGTLYNEGRYAAAKGLDGIEIHHTARAPRGGGAGHVASATKPAYNWLNRSVLIIQAEPG